MTDWEKRAKTWCDEGMRICNETENRIARTSYLAGVRAGMERAEEIVAPGASIHPLMAGALDAIRAAMPKGE